MLFKPQKRGRMKDWKDNVLVMPGAGVAASHQVTLAFEALPNKSIKADPGFAGSAYYWR